MTNPQTIDELLGFLSEILDDIIVSESGDNGEITIETGLIADLAGNLFPLEAYDLMLESDLRIKDEIVAKEMQDFPYPEPVESPDFAH